MIKAAGNITGSSHALAKALRDPHLGASAELSAGGRLPGWVVLPSMQLGNENGNGTVGVTAELPGKLSNLGSYQVELKPSGGEPTLKATFRGPLVAGGSVLEGVKVYQQYSVEFQYRNNYDYLHALGIDSRTIPGVSTVLGIMDRFTGRHDAEAASSPASGTPASPSGAAANVLRQLQDDIQPALFQSASKWDKVTMGEGYVMVVDRSAAERNGIEAKGALTISEMQMERIDSEKREDEPVKFEESSVGASLGAESGSVGKLAEAKIDGGVSLTHSTDPEELEKPVSPDRERMAKSLEDGSFADAASEAMEALSPVTQARQIQDFITATGQNFDGDNVKGVKIRFDEDVLRRVINAGTLDEDMRTIVSFTDDFSQAGDEGQKRALVARFTGELRRRYQLGKVRERVDNLALVSLQAVVLQAQSYGDHWDDLPDGLRHPGNITRIVGYVWDTASHDVLLIGSVEPDAPPIELDDLIVGVRAVLRDNATPLCSLDPMPGDLAGPQKVRIGGVPRDSAFAKAMLDADYVMKKLQFGVLRVKNSSFTSLREILETENGYHSFISRQWLYPVQPGRGDIQVSNDGKLVLFSCGVQAFSEEEAEAKEGLVGKGQVVAEAEQAAQSFTRSYADIERQYGEYQRLNGLFDIVLLASIWRRMDVKSEEIDRLVALPYRAIDIPATYAGITANLGRSDAPAELCGGVQVEVSPNPDLFLVLESPEMAAIARRSRAASSGSSIAIPLPNLSVEIASPGGDLDAQLRNRTRVAKAFASINAGDAHGAAADMTPWIQADESDPVPWAIRSFANYMSGDYAQARSDATSSRNLDPDNANSVLLASIVLFLVDRLQGDPDGALSEIDRALSISPASVRAITLRGDALATLGRKSEARAEFKQAIKMDPTSAVAYVNLGALELSDGWVVRGMNLIRKARQLSQVSADLPVVKAAMAAAEVENAALVSPLANNDDQLAHAASLAREALDDPACDPQSRILAWSALITVAVHGNDWDQASHYIQEMQRLAPSSPEPLLVAAETAHEFKRDDLAQRYLEQARKMAPAYPGIDAARRKVGGL